MLCVTVSCRNVRPGNRWICIQHPAQLLGQITQRASLRLSRLTDWGNGGGCSRLRQLLNQFKFVFDNFFVLVRAAIHARRSTL